MTVVGDESLDVHGWGERIEWNTTRIDHAHAVSTDKPQPSVRCLGDLRNVVSTGRSAPDSVAHVEDSRVDPPRGEWVLFDCRNPGIQFGPRDLQEPARRVQPQGPGVVMNSPVNRVAGQAV